MKIPIVIVLFVLCVYDVFGNVCNVRDYGAKGDGVTYDTTAIRKAIVDCHARWPSDATVLVENGKFLTGAFNLTSNMTLLVKHASIMGSMRPQDYPVVSALPSYGTCRDHGYPSSHQWQRHQALISGWNVENTRIVGDGGTVDGQGEVWWARMKSNSLDYGRPRLIEPMYCTNFSLTSMHLMDSAFWTTHPYACDGVYIADLNITATGPNTDGLDPDSSKNVLIERCSVNVGDDAVAIKSGMDYAGRTFNRAAENIVIRDSHFISRRVSIGSEMSGGVRNVTIENCVLGGEDSNAVYPGVYIKSQRGRGGVVDGIVYRNISSSIPLALPIYISMYYSKHVPPTNKTATPRVQNLLFDQWLVNVAIEAGSFQGLPEQHIQNVTLQNVDIVEASNGWQCSDIDNLHSSGRVVPPLPSKCSK